MRERRRGRGGWLRVSAAAQLCGGSVAPPPRAAALDPRGQGPRSSRPLWEGRGGPGLLREAATQLSHFSPRPPREAAGRRLSRAAWSAGGHRSVRVWRAGAGTSIRRRVCQGLAGVGMRRAGLVYRVLMPHEASAAPWGTARLSRVNRRKQAAKHVENACKLKLIKSETGHMAQQPCVALATEGASKELRTFTALKP